MPVAQNLFSANAFLPGFNQVCRPTFLQLQWIRLLANQQAGALLEKTRLRLLEPHADDFLLLAPFLSKE